MTTQRRHFDRRSVVGGGTAVPLLLACAPPGDAVNTQSISGVWTGVLDTGSNRLRLRFTVTADGGGTLESLDQGGAAMAIRVTRAAAGEVAIRVDAARGRFEGRLDGDAIVGRWIQGAALPLTLRRGDAGLAQTPAPSEPLTQARLAEWRRAAGVPAAVAARGTREAAAQFLVEGERAAGSGAAATADDLWHIGSNTKSMTATLVARLVEAGRVRWDDTIADCLGAEAPSMRDAWRSITFKHLLSHRAGFQPNLPATDMIGFALDRRDMREQRRAYVRKALAGAPVGPKETGFAYSNVGYVVAGAMLEAKADTPWEALMRAQVFEPLGLASAGFGPRLGAQPQGHTGDRTPKPRPDGDNPAVVGPAGRVHASMGDLLKYLAAHRDRAPFLSAASWDMLHTPPFGGDYAMGWMARPDGSRWHNGSNTYWYAELAFDAERGVSAAAASNDRIERAQSLVGRMLRATLEHPLS